MEIQAIRVNADELTSFCKRAFKKYGFSDKDADTITDVLLAADLYGVDTHGSQRLEMYRKQIQKGFIHVENQPKIAFETPISAVVDGNRAMGQVVGKYAMEIAIEKAKKSGIGLVTVRNSNHYGIASYYSKLACNEGLIGVSMTNSFPVVVPTFGKRPMMGTNPIAVSIPADPVDFNFDVATSVVAYGKVEVRNKKGIELPIGWGINDEGKDAINPMDIINGIAYRSCGLHPLGGSSELFGGHKGFGFSLIVEFLTAILSNGFTSNHSEDDGIAGICHYFMAIDPNLFGDAEQIKSHWNTYLQEVRDSEKAYQQDRIYIHGEKEAEKHQDRLDNGVPILPKTLEEMENLAKQLDMEFGITLPE
ncbi:Ldh family oxidoreductase [Peptostreptococcus russellii]|uniref:Ldh family oxidoreductase n=1 Tax=Peptostreptococcus russellii TaxID=215200 RepID=UPI001A9BB789|nr:Ldh family oxidoreductase [Peptostreptococcus russellii]